MDLFKNMRIGVRIAAGYIAVLALLALLFGVGAQTLGTLARQVLDLNNAGEAALGTSETQVALVRLRLDTQLYVSSGAEAALTALKADVDQIQHMLSKLGGDKFGEGAARDVAALNDLLDKFRVELAPVVSGRQKWDRTVHDELQVSGPGARQKLDELIDAAVTRNDVSGALAFSRITDRWMEARLSLSRFLTTPDDKGAEATRQLLADFDHAFKALLSQQDDVKVKAAINEVLGLTERYADKANELMPAVLQGKHTLGELLPDIGNRLDGALETFQTRMQHRQAETEAAAQDSIAQAQRFNLATGIAALVVGLFLAVVIGRSVLNAMGRALDTLNDAARQVATGSNQASVAVGQVSEGARNQMNAVRQIGVAIKQSANAIEDVAGSSGQTYKFTKEAVAMVDNAMHNVANLDRLVRTISENSRNISRITGVITRIANQTNMLSLNAAIEAARAGEHGRGFAVVAEEVRKLAEEVAASAQEIVEIVSAANVEAEKGVAVSRDVGTDMGKIGDIFRQIERMASVIASATTEQQASTKEIDATVQSLAQISESNATASEEILATMNELVKIADSARCGAENFKAMM